MKEINLITRRNWKDDQSLYTIADSTKTFIIPLTPQTNVSIQAFWTGLTGTLDGTLVVQAGNNPIYMDDYTDGTITMNVAAGSGSWTKNWFNFAYIAVTFTQNNLNLAGNLGLKLVYKSKHSHER